MIDLHTLRNASSLIEQIAKKDPSYDGKLLIELDQKVRTLTLDVESLRHRKNEPQ